jgi:hypothetical protein
MNKARRDYKSLGFSSYDDYLHSEHWQTTVRRFKGTSCWCCGSGTFLDLHHRTYARLGEEKAGDLVTLCRRCHELVHKEVRDGRSYLGNAHVDVRGYLGVVQEQVPSARKPKKQRKKKVLAKCETCGKWAKRGELRCRHCLKLVKKRKGPPAGSWGFVKKGLPGVR